MILVYLPINCLFFIYGNRSRFSPRANQQKYPKACKVNQEFHKQYLEGLFVYFVLLERGNMKPLSNRKLRWFKQNIFSIWISFEHCQHHHHRPQKQHHQSLIKIIETKHCSQQQGLVNKNKNPHEIVCSWQRNQVQFLSQRRRSSQLTPFLLPW